MRNSIPNTLSRLRTPTPAPARVPRQLNSVRIPYCTRNFATGINGTGTGAPAPTPTPTAAPRVSRVPAFRDPGSTLFKFKIVIAPSRVSKKVYELTRRAAVSKHLLRGVPAVHSTLDRLGKSPVPDVGPVIFSLDGNLDAHPEIIRACNALGVPWVYVPACEGLVGTGRSDVDVVMVVPWMINGRDDGGTVVQAKVANKELKFRAARRVVGELMVGAWDLDRESGDE